MPKRPVRFIFVIGGVLSGLGKGIAVSSIGMLLRDRGFRVSAMKIDPYINVDAGTMNPTEHGEVFVTHDGLETDQDIGNYERFLDLELSRDSYMTTGQVYQSVITRERSLGYHGKCVEAVPHIPEEVIHRIDRAAAVTKAEILLIEIGGTVGEYQNLVFLEAARMMHLRRPGFVQFILVSYLPIPSKLGEMKTKPTQYAVHTLNAAGIQPDFILGRASAPLDRPRKERLSVNCNMHPDDIISAPDVANIYTVPAHFAAEGLPQRILQKFSLKARHPVSPAWTAMIRRACRAKTELRIGIVGKYFHTGAFTLADSYVSVIEAIKHAAWAIDRKPVIDWLDAETYEKHPERVTELSTYDGLLVPGGFGPRGVEGKIAAIEYARQQQIPFFGLCYGMQLAAIEFARHVLGWKDANTTEVNPKTTKPIFALLPEQLVLLREKRMGGSMRLGSYTCRLALGSKTATAYGQASVVERHRHRYEFQNTYLAKCAAKGLRPVGREPGRGLVEILELDNHPWFIGTQFHPEFLSHPLRPHPLFLGFMKAADHRRGLSVTPKKTIRTTPRRPVARRPSAA